MNIFRKKEKNKAVKVQRRWKIRHGCLDLILECARSSYPNEFGGLLRVDTNSKDTISEIVVLPGTISGDSHAIFKLHMLPIDFSIVGTVHSHPSPSFHPSDADIHLFGKFGRVHIIVARPFNDESWRAYDCRGNELEMEVI